ncbi:MAG: hypothetical protein AAGB11_15860 [Pseudomonadota bacterium]
MPLVEAYFCNIARTSVAGASGLSIPLPAGSGSLPIDIAIEHALR